MDDLMILSLDIQYLKENMKTHMLLQEKATTELVQEAIEKKLSMENVTQRIQEKVSLCIDNAIDSLASDYRLQNIFKNIIIDSLRLDKEQTNASDG